MNEGIEAVVELAVQAVIRGDRETARAHLERIDFAELLDDSTAARRAIRREQRGQEDPIKTLRGSASEKQKLLAYRRDYFTCVFCGRRTLYTPVLRALSAEFSATMPYRNGNWTPKADHAIYWTWSTSWEHLRPVARGGSSTDPLNLITACYQCNDLKGDWLYSEIGWAVHPPVRSAWDGLSSYLPDLNRALNLRPMAALSAGIPMTGVMPVSSLIRATIHDRGLARRAPFRVDYADADTVVLVEMWRTGADHKWRESSKAKRLNVASVSDVEVLRTQAPEPGEIDA